MTNATDEDLGWDDEFTIALTRRGLDPKTAEACAEEALAHCAESGESLREAFGDPEDYAETVAVSRIPAAKRARTDLDDVTMDEYWGAPLTLPAYKLVLAGIIVWIGKGLWIEVTVAGLAGSLVIVLALVLAGAAYALRAAGHRRASIATGCVAVALSVPAALAFFELPGTGMGRIPTPSLIVAGLLLNWLGERLERPDAAVRRALRQLPLRARDSASPEPASPEPVTPEARAALQARETHRWLSRLHGLLRGRHYVRRGEARRLVADARQHLETTGARPQDEFGDVERYALSLVEEGGAKRLTRKELGTYRNWAILGICALQLSDAPWSGTGWSDWGFLGIAVVTGIGLARHYRTKWQAGTASSPPPDAS